MGKRILALLAVLWLAVGFDFSGDGSDGFADQETVTHTNMNEIDSGLDALEARADNTEALIGVQADVLRFITAADPTTNADTEAAVDAGVWGNAGIDAIEFYDGVASTYLLGVRVSDTPSAGQVPKWNADGTITWEADGGGSAVEIDIGGDGVDSSGATRIVTESDNLGIASLAGDILTFDLGYLQSLGYAIGQGGGGAGEVGAVLFDLSDTPADGQCLVWNDGDIVTFEPCPGGGDSDIDLVGDCTDGDCFDGSSDGGTQLTLYAVEATAVVANVAGTLDVSRPVTATRFDADDPGDGNRVVTLQDNSAACPDPSSGSTSLCAIGGRTYSRDSGASSLLQAVVIASGATAVDPTSIASEACATVVSATATGAATTDVISWTPASDISGVTGYAPVDTGGVIIYPYATSNLVNFKVCNPTLGSIDPGAITLNWKVIR